MGCKETKEQTYPTLLCFFEIGNEEQKQYCLTIKDHFQHDKPIKFEIKSQPQITFSIQFKFNEQTHMIQETFDNSEKAMNDALLKMYNILDGNK